MDPIVYGDTESNFGLMIRDRYNHDNYVFIDFEHLDKLFEKYHSLKKMMKYDKKLEKEEN